jgi:hypothetical protein
VGAGNGIIVTLIAFEWAASAIDRVRLIREADDLHRGMSEPCYHGVNTGVFWRDEG